MQRPCEQKRRKILDAAAALFAERPFHEVRLDDVALAARVGKGTLYIYFSSKEDLFDELLVTGFEQMLARVTDRAASPDTRPWDALGAAVEELVDWATKSPHFFRLVHSDEKPATPRLRARRREFGQLIQRVILRGIEAGDFVDPHPELTAQFIPSCLRGALRFGPEQVDPELVKRHMLWMLGNGIRADRMGGLELPEVQEEPVGALA